MKRISQFLVCVLVFAFAAVSMSTWAAPAKTYSVSATSPIPAGGGTVTLTITNVTPSGGNSAINSILITKPAGWTISQPLSSIGSSTLVLDGSGNLRVNAFSGLLPKNQQGVHSIAITFNLTPSTPVGCSAGSIAWPSLLGIFTGNAFSGDMFTWDGVGGTSVVSASTCYSVTYNPNGNTSGTAPTDSTLYASGATVTVKANTGSLARTGYTFIGWNTAANGSGTDYDASGSATFTISANTTLYAKWQQITHSVTYVGNGNTGGTAPVDFNTYASGATVTVLGAGSLTRTGYTFATWNTAANGSGTSYAPGATFTMGVTPVTLYAQWTQNTMTIVGPVSAPHLNESFTVTVNFNPPLPGASVTLTSTNCSLNPAPVGTPGSGFVDFAVTVISAPSNSCTFVATATDGSYATAQQAIAISKTWAGDLGTECSNPVPPKTAGGLGGTLNSNPPQAYIGPPNWGLQRAVKDAKPANTSCTAPVQYEFQFDPDAVPQKAAFVIVGNPTNLAPAVEYVLLWKATDTATVLTEYPGFPYANVYVGWLKNGNDWIYVPGLPCADADLEQQDGSPLPLIPNLAPFNNGNQPEGYRPGDTAQVCVAQEGWTSVGKDQNGNILRQYWHRIYDFKDAGARLGL